MSTRLPALLCRAAAACRASTAAAVGRACLLPRHGAAHRAIAGGLRPRHAAFSGKAPYATLDPATRASAIATVERHLATGNTAIANGDYAAALTAYEHAVAAAATASADELSSPGAAALAANAHYNLGNALLVLGRWEEAVPAWEASAALDPSQADVLVNLANIAAVKMGDFEHAAVLLGRAVALPEGAEDGETRFNYGCILDRLGRLDAAIVEFEAAKSCGIERAEQNIRNTRQKMMEGTTAKTSDASTSSEASASTPSA
ncbi:hypothetical protein CXG81DRAFT_20224 [Caulochytrium protostelioides]|uniref:Uncharacterized protein n=1 Tax=Caulochytrium protostelioides TaxID=1555241 RepID=A0A4P9X3W3_9FUNG|nr:hypothetical protein CXG81DRAFT_20224 [Caulochytrium protostelioides]|eukprot:RKO99737.1 hypothetical protein CXG81DRAFT_20224 [Caulochytrium protostelioides]